MDLEDDDRTDDFDDGEDADNEWDDDDEDDDDEMKSLPSRHRSPGFFRHRR
jgi:hypothetical protein